MAQQTYDWSRARFFFGSGRTALTTIQNFNNINVSPKITVEKTYGAGDTHVGQGVGKKEWDNVTFDIGVIDLAAIIVAYFDSKPEDLTKYLNPSEYIPLTIEMGDVESPTVTYTITLSRIISAVASLAEGTTTDTMYTIEATVDGVKTKLA